MLIFRVTAAAVLLGIAALIWTEGTAERRYANSVCQYQLIHQAPEEMGLVSVGGSRMLTALDAIDLNAYLDADGTPHSRAFNLAHSHYTLGKEYVLLRDLFENWSPKAVLVMLEPRAPRVGQVHPEFTELAKLRDIPIYASALWTEDPAAAVQSAVEILRHHLRFGPKLAERYRKPPANLVFNCHRGDYRLTLDHLELGEKRRKAGTKTFEWDSTLPEERFNRVLVRAISELAQQNGAQAIFLHLPRTGSPVPDPTVSEAFKAATGADLITLDQDLADRLSISGRRDLTHINAEGRSILLPWLIERVRSICRIENGCF